MIRRIRQFFRAVLPRRLDPYELDRLERYLSAAERALFFQMSGDDQKHAVSVSRRVEHLARRRGVWDGKLIRIIVRAALLHDIGKIRGDLGVWDRVAIVLTKRFSRSEAWIRDGFDDLLQGRIPPSAHTRHRRRRNAKGPSWRADFRRARLTHAVHPARGAAMAGLMGVEEEVVSLIRRHQQENVKPGETDERDILLELLIDADRTA